MASGADLRILNNRIHPEASTPFLRPNHAMLHAIGSRWPIGDLRRRDGFVRRGLCEIPTALMARPHLWASRRPIITALGHNRPVVSRGIRIVLSTSTFGFITADATWTPGETSGMLTFVNEERCHPGDRLLSCR